MFFPFFGLPVMPKSASRPVFKWWSLQLKQFSKINSPTGLLLI